MTKTEIIEVLTEAGVEFDSTATKAELEALLPEEETEEVESVDDTDEEVESVDDTDEEVEGVDETVKVFDKRRRLMRTFTGKNARKDAEALASQPRRDGWTVV